MEAWTNPSVIALAGDRDPVEAITERARQLVVQGMDAGWSGPPYDPLLLADIIGLEVHPTEGVRDAQTVPTSKGRMRVDFNPGRPRARVRFSIAHEIAHSLFPDCGERIRERAAYHDLRGDDWQLETLCNIAAGEIVMPLGSLPESDLSALSIEHLVDLRRRYEVSMEALLNRLVRVTDAAVAMFAASRTGDAADRHSYSIEYAVASGRWSVSHLRGHHLASTSVVGRCTAIGMADEATEHWPTIAGASSVQCVAVQPHPGSIYPRVVGLLRPQDASAEREALLQEVPGDALEPRRTGPAIIAHIVNDRTPNWGGRGFAQQLRGRFPAVQADFQKWVIVDRSRLQLGNVRAVDVDKRLTVATMVAQSGYGPSLRPRVRYQALERCLEMVRELALERRATVHMPRIGTGAGGGDWRVIRDMVDASLCRIGVRTLVYGSMAPRMEQTTLL